MPRGNSRVAYRRLSSVVDEDDSEASSAAQTAAEQASITIDDAHLQQSYDQHTHMHGGRRGDDTDSLGAQPHVLHELEAPAINVSRWRHQRNLDRFFRRCYQFYLNKGKINAILGGILDHCSVAFVALVLLFLAGAVDYHALRERIKYQTCGTNGEREEASLFEDGCHGYRPFDFRYMSNLPWIVWLVVATFGVIWLWSLFNFLRGIPELREMELFYTVELNISQRELSTIPWHKVVEKLVDAQKRLEMCITMKDLDELDITNLITRKSNYLISLYNNEILDTSLQLPYLGRRVFLPKSLQWNIERCLLYVIFDKDNNLQKKVKSPDGEDQFSVEARLAKYFWVFGLLNFALMPFILIWRIVVFIFENAVEFRRGSGKMTGRQWSPYARWRLREYCEVDHVFHDRLNKSYKPSLEYVDLFVSSALTVVARFFLFVVGGVFVTLFLFSIVFDDFLEVNFTAGRSVTWWLGITGAALALCRNLIPDEHMVFDPVASLHRATVHTHYYPDAWRGNETSLDVLDEFTQLFQFRLVVFLEELLSVVIAPYILCFRLPSCAHQTVQFIRKNTVFCDGIGDVCAFALFRRRDGAAAYASLTENIDGTTSQIPLLSDQDRHQKLEHSIINFKKQHPRWQPADTAAKELLERSMASLSLSYPGEENLHSLHESLLPIVPSYKQPGTDGNVLSPLEHSVTYGEYMAPTPAQVAAQGSAQTPVAMGHQQAFRRHHPGVTVMAWGLQQPSPAQPQARVYGQAAGDAPASAPASGAAAARVGDAASAGGSYPASTPLYHEPQSEDEPLPFAAHSPDEPLPAPIGLAHRPTRASTDDEVFEAPPAPEHK